MIRTIIYIFVCFLGYSCIKSGHKKQPWHQQPSNKGGKSYKPIRHK